MKVNCRCQGRFRFSSSSAFTFVEMMVVVATIGLLAALSIPNLVKARDTTRLNVIYRNLRAIDTAKEQWALEQNKGEGALVSDVSDLKDYLRGGKVRAVISENYEPNPVGTLPDAALPAGVRLGPYGPGAVIQAP